MIEVREYSPHEVGGQSFGFVANAVMPDYGKLPLTTTRSGEGDPCLPGEAAPARPKHRLPPARAALPRRAPAARSAWLPISAPTSFRLSASSRTSTAPSPANDPVTGEKLPRWEQALAFLGAIPLSWQDVTKGVRKGIKWLGRGLSWLKGRGAVLSRLVAPRRSSNGENLAR